MKKVANSKANDGATGIYLCLQVLIGGSSKRHASLRVEENEKSTPPVTPRFLLNF